LDKVLKHKEELFGHLRQRWQDLFGARFDVLLYDLTSTYFESDPPFEETDKRQFGYSRDKRSDCVQVVIGLIVTPEGFPLAYEVLPGNTSDKTTLRKFLRKIEEQYGKAERVWLMDRGVPTEEVLTEMRSSIPVPIYYLVGTPKGRLSKLEADLLERPWQSVRPGVEVKVLPQENELYVFAQSRDRLNKERAMRRRQLKALWRRLGQLQQMKLTARELLIKLGEAKGRYRAAWRLMNIQFPKPTTKGIASFSFALNRQKLRIVRRREGRYLLRTNLLGRDPAQLWQFYILLVEIEAAFKNLKDDLALRPIFHQLERRIEAHIFVAFMAYCLHVTLRARLRPLAPGLTPRAVLDKFAAIQMLDVHFPTTDGRTLILSRYTHPEPDQKILLEQLKLTLPAQPPPRISSRRKLLEQK
jgi:transposase